MDAETYLGIVLRGAATASFRYTAGESRKPSEVLRSVDPTPASPGLNSYAVLPTYPATNYVTDNGLFTSVPGEPVNHANNAMSAFQNLLRPPAAQQDPAAVKAGRAVFDQAGCGACHSGPALTNHRVIPDCARSAPNRPGPGPGPRWRRGSRLPACSPPTRRSRCRPIR